jgi:hypothetical protein
VLRWRRYLLTSLLVPASLWCLSTADGLCGDVHVEQPLHAKQGEVLYLTLHVEGEPTSVQGRFRERLVPFFKTGREGEFGALVGIDMADAPDTANLKAEVMYPDGVRKRVYRDRKSVV